MSTTSREAAAEPLENLLLDYPNADIIIRSWDCYHFRVLKTIITINSPILGDLIQKTIDFPDNANTGASLPMVKLPERGEILRHLLTFIFPETPLLPPTVEEIMKLLFAAQKYQMGTALTHIRGSIARKNSLPTCLEPALQAYALAQKYGLRPEALQTARTIMNYPMTIENLYNKLNSMPGDSLHELWKYHERVRAVLASDLAEFRTSHGRGTISGLRCTELSSSNIPIWLDHYIESIGSAPNLFDLFEFDTSKARHIKENSRLLSCKCASIPSKTMRNFWKVLTSVVHGSFEKVSICRCAELQCYYLGWVLVLFTGRISSISCTASRGPSSPT